MKWTKRLAAILVAAMLLAALTACAGGASFKHGTWEDNTFKSETAGITFVLPDDDAWSIMSDEEMAQMMGIEDASKLEQTLVKMANIQDMMVQNTQTGSSVALLYENTKMTNSSDLTEEEFASVLAENLAATADIDYIVGETFTQTVCGQEYTVLPTTVEAYGLNQNYLLRRQDNYMVEIVVTGLGQEEIDSLMAMFQ